MTIATMRSSLTQDDIRRLIRGDTPEARAMAVSSSACSVQSPWRVVATSSAEA